MKIAIVIGGSGYIGRFLIRDLLASAAFDRIYNLDIVARDFGDARVEFRKTDVRHPIPGGLAEFDADHSWIFNLAALCREPGSEPAEYFETNVGGAENVCAFAERLGFRNIYFTSTMSSYGRMEQPTPEITIQRPETPYGISKAVAEKTHLIWLGRDPGRRLIICRPSVIFGPEDKENVPRMIKAIAKGYFLFPGSPDIVKGYGYVFGLVESMRFVREKRERFIVYNYAERECLSLRGMAETIQVFLGKRALVLRFPLPLLLAAAYGLQIGFKLLGKTNPIHPVRVKKVGFPTNLKPAYLIENGFTFNYPLAEALKHWKGRDPAFFNL